MTISASAAFSSAAASVRGSASIAALISPEGSTCLAIVFSTPSDMACWMERRVSSSSASRTSSSTPLRNSPAILRAWRRSEAPVRMALGNSLGPSTSKATTSRMAICDQLRSNMKDVPADGSAGGFVLAAQIGLDGLVVALGGLGFFLHALLEGRDALAQILHQIGNLAAPPEDDEDDQKQDKPVPDAKRSHAGLLERAVRD